MDFFKELTLEKKLNILTENFTKTSLSYPSRKELAGIFLENETDIEVLKIERKSFFQVSQFLLDRVHTTKKKLIAKISEIYTSPINEPEFIGNLIASNKISSIVNFGYDNNFNDSSSFSKLLPSSFLPVSRNSNSDKLKLYKPLGDIEDLDKAIITNQDLKRLMDLNYYNEYYMSLRSELRSKTNLIIGVDVNNYDFFQILNFILGDISSSSFKFYFIVEEEIKNEFIKKIIKKYNIKVIKESSLTLSKNLLNLSLGKEIIQEEVVVKEEINLREEVLDNLQYPLFDSVNVSNNESSHETTIIAEIEDTYSTEEILVPEIIQENLNFQEEVQNKITEVSCESIEVEEVIEDEVPYLPQTITLNEEQVEISTAFDLKFTSCGLDTLPIMSSNLPTDISLEDIEVIGNADIKIGSFIFNNCYIKVIGAIEKDIRLLEIKSKEMIIRIGINYFTSGNFSLTGDYLFYKIYSNVSLNRAINILEMLDSLFSNLELEFDLPKLSGKVLLNKPLEVVKIKALLNLFNLLKSSNQKIHFDKFEGIENIYSKLNLNLLDEEVEHKTWCNYVVSKDLVNPEDNLIVNKIYKINEKLAIEACISIKKPVSSNDLVEDKFIAHKKVCTMKLKKVKGW